MTNAYVMKGIDNGMASERPVRLFVTGDSKWVDEGDWTVPGRQGVRCYLHPSGKANSMAGDGLLGTEAPGGEASDRFTCDPADPVPTTGGPTIVDPRPKVGPCDQRDVERCQDVLVYSTAAFGSDAGVIGSVALELEVSSSAVDADFTGKLVDIRPDGTAINLKEGIIRARYRLSRERTELMRPGDVCRVSVDLGSAARIFLAGHRMSIGASCRSFPHDDRNLNTGAGPGDASARAVPATNQVFHDSARPSALVAAMAP